VTFSIVIPAYNEEESIEAIIQRCLAAEEAIIKQTSADEVEVIVVSDGSYDRTAELAQGYVPRIKLIAYPKNKGYGRAIKIGFRAARGELVSFLDADGTCDPLYFVDMINKLEQTGADICIGSRLGPNTKMPRIRRLGNRLWRSLLHFLSGVRVSDTASGMRVIRRNRLTDIYPLPDGLHFTPAMSARAVMDSSLSMVEVDMSYEERQGKSKLAVFSDGLRFLKVIVSSALTYRPLRLLAVPASVLIILALAYGSASLYSYFTEGHVPQSAIYRLMSVVVFGVSGLLLMGLAVLAQKAVALAFRTPPKRVRRISAFLRWSFSWRLLFLAAPVLLLAGLFINRETIRSYFLSGTISSHWSVVAAGGYLVLLGMVSFFIGVVDYLFDLIRERLEVLESDSQDH